MAKHIRIIERQPSLSFSERLENRARAIVRKSESAEWNPAPLAVIERDLAFTLHRLQRQRGLHAAFADGIQRLASSVQDAVELRQTGRLRYSRAVEEIPELRDRLAQLEREQVRIAQWHEERIEQLQDRLLTALNRHTLLWTGHQ